VEIQTCDTVEALVIRFPSEVSIFGIDLWEDQGSRIKGTWHHFPEWNSGICRLVGVGLACGFCQNLYVIYQMTSHSPRIR